VTAAPGAGTAPVRTRKGRQTDEAFREAARLVFARDGYLNAKISDIAAEAGRSVASFYNYYDTKADLLIALAEEFHAEATQMAALPYRSGLTREEALRQAVAGFWRTYAKRRGEHRGYRQGPETVGWEVQGDSSVGFLACTEHACAGGEDQGVSVIAAFPHNVCGGQGAAAAQGELGLWAEPPQLRVRLSTTDECGGG